MSWLAEWLLASQGGLCSMESVTWLTSSVMLLDLCYLVNYIWKGFLAVMLPPFCLVISDSCSNICYIQFLPSFFISPSRSAALLFAFRSFVAQSKSSVQIHKAKLISPSHYVNFLSLRQILNENCPVLFDIPHWNLHFYSIFLTGLWYHHVPFLSCTSPPPPPVTFEPVGYEERRARGHSAFMHTWNDLWLRSVHAKGKGKVVLWLTKHRSMKTHLLRS
jgi:hypothetical protein